MNDAPLKGKRIIVTRAREQADVLAEKIRALGGAPILFPAIAFAPLENFFALDDALNNLRAFDWVVFTSANGVRFVAERCDTLGMKVPELNHARVAAIGSATARALHERNLCVDFMPTKFLTEQIARELPFARGERVLLLRADIASNELAHELCARGAQVSNVDAYRTLRAKTSNISWRDADALTFTSSSTVENLFASVDDARTRIHALDIFCIGPVTANTARDFGLNVTAVANEHTMDGLVRVMCEYYERNESHAVSGSENAYAL